MSSRRLFAAIRPPAGVLDHLDLALTDIRAGTGAGLRWPPDEQRHLTVAFFPAVPDSATADIEAALAEIAGQRPPLRLRLRGAGSFAGRTLWIGVAGDLNALTGLMADGSAIDYAQPGDRHRAHLTVARPSRRSRGTELAPLVHALAVYSGPEWTADTLELVCSRLGAGRGGGALHEVIGTVRLGG